jgi:hypothetical protein
VAPWFILVSFFILHFAKNVAWEQRSLSGKVFFPPKEQDPVFNLDSLICSAHERQLFDKLLW